MNKFVLNLREGNGVSSIYSVVMDRLLRGDTIWSNDFGTLNLCEIIRYSDDAFHS